MTGREIIGLVLLLICICQARDSHNAKQLLWEDQEGDSQARRFSDTYEATPTRDGRKLVIINNKAYDLSEEEQSRMWDLHLKKGYIPDLDSHADPPTLNTPVAAGADSEGSEERQRDNLGMDSYSSLGGVEITKKIGSGRQPVKASRFVVDPDKKKLIVSVDEEEFEQLKQEATTAHANAADRVVTESPAEASTVVYEYTQVSVLSYIWREFLNIGDLLGREVVDNMSNTLWYLWQSVVKFVQSRGRRSLPGPSPDL